MALDQKIEAVKKVSEALEKQPQQAVEQAEHAERVPPNREHFQNLLNTSTVQPAFGNGNEIAQQPIDAIDKNPVFADEQVTAQKNGSATDQEGKKKQGHSGVEEIEGVTSKSSTWSSGPGRRGSLMDEVRKLNQQASSMSKLTPDDIRDQAKGLIAQIDDVKTQLAKEMQTDIKPSYQNLLRNRLTHIDENLKIALSKAGVEYTAPPQALAGPNQGNPLQKFLGYLTHGQYQLEHLEQTIQHLNLTGAEFTPSHMLTLQIKMGYVSQQIELFTSLLNKALEATKTIMNVQV